MSVSITFFQDPTVTDNLKILKKITKGTFKVYQAYSASAREAYAIKVFPNNASGTRQFNRESILSNLSHPNIIKYIPVTVDFENDSHFHCIVTEFAKYGDIFDMVVGDVFSSEILVRTYFHQLVAGVGYLHSQGVAHLDLKLENLMLGSGFTLKIIDFDQAQKTKEKRLISAGTNGFRAPEVIDTTCTNFKAADIYSLGIILYAMKAKSAPFAEVTVQDENRDQRTSLTHYSTFLSNNYAFWEMKASRKNEPGFFSQDFRELVNGMLEFEVPKRFTLVDIKNSNWFNGPVLSKEELRAEMKTRLQSFQKK